MLRKNTTTKKKKTFKMRVPSLKKALIKMKFKEKKKKLALFCSESKNFYNSKLFPFAFIIEKIYIINLNYLIFAKI